MIKSVLKYILIFFLKLLPLRKIILFESFPDFSDSSMEIYKELINRGYNKKYKLVWMNSSETTDREFVVPKTIIQRFYYHYVAKCIITGNRIIYKVKKNQCVFYLTHGGPAKSVKDYYFFKGEISYCIIISQNSVEETADNLHISKNKVIGLGQPRVSEIINSDVRLENIFGHYEKYIFWYPTFKTNKSGRVVGNGLPIPFCDNLENLERIDSVCRQNDVLLVIKVHFSQTDSTIINFRFKNIIFADFSFFKNKGVSSYKCLAKADALVTDYSSVFYDFLVVDKPICFIWDDINLYKENNGLYKIFYDYSSDCGTKVYDVDQFCCFIEKVANGVDENMEMRKKVFESFYPFEEIDPTKRVTDFIIDKSRL